MRVYREADILSLENKMFEAGFRFRSDEDLLTTEDMAVELGISQTHLRHLERRVVIPHPSRGSAGRRVWRRTDVALLKVLLKRRPRRSLADAAD